MTKGSCFNVIRRDDKSACLGHCTVRTPRSKPRGFWYIGKFRWVLAGVFCLGVFCCGESAFASYAAEAEIRKMIKGAGDNIDSLRIIERSCNTDARYKKEAKTACTRDLPAAMRPALEKEIRVMIETAGEDLRSLNIIETICMGDKYKKADITPCTIDLPAAIKAAVDGTTGRSTTEKADASSKTSLSGKEKESAKNYINATLASNKTLLKKYGLKADGFKISAIKGGGKMPKYFVGTDAGGLWVDASVMEFDTFDDKGEIYNKEITIKEVGTELILITIDNKGMTDSIKLKFNELCAEIERKLSGLSTAKFKQTNSKTPGAFCDIIVPDGWLLDFKDDLLIVDDATMNFDVKFNENADKEGYNMNFYTITSMTKDNKEQKFSLTEKVRKLSAEAETTPEKTTPTTDKKPDAGVLPVPPATKPAAAPPAKDAKIKQAENKVAIAKTKRKALDAEEQGQLDSCKKAGDKEAVATCQNQTKKTYAKKKENAEQDLTSAREGMKAQKDPSYVPKTEGQQAAEKGIAAAKKEKEIVNANKEKQMKNCKEAGNSKTVEACEEAVTKDYAKKKSIAKGKLEQAEKNLEEENKKAPTAKGAPPSDIKKSEADLKAAEKPVKTGKAPTPPLKGEELDFKPEQKLGGLSDEIKVGIGETKDFSMISSKWTKEKKYPITLCALTKDTATFAINGMTYMPVKARAKAGMDIDGDGLNDIEVDLREVTIGLEDKDTCPAKKAPAYARAIAIRKAKAAAAAKARERAAKKARERAAAKARAKETTKKPVTGTGECGWKNFGKCKSFCSSSEAHLQGDKDCSGENRCCVPMAGADEPCGMVGTYPKENIAKCKKISGLGCPDDWEAAGGTGLFSQKGIDCKDNYKCCRETAKAGIGKKCTGIHGDMAPGMCLSSSLGFTWACGDGDSVVHEGKCESGRCCIRNGEAGNPCGTEEKALCVGDKNPKHAKYAKYIDRSQEGGLCKYGSGGMGGRDCKSELHCCLVPAGEYESAVSVKASAVPSASAVSKVAKPSVTPAGAGTGEKSFTKEGSDKWYVTENGKKREVTPAEAAKADRDMEAAFGKEASGGAEAERTMQQTGTVYKGDRVRGRVIGERPVTDRERSKDREQERKDREQERKDRAQERKDRAQERKKAGGVVKKGFDHPLPCPWDTSEGGGQKCKDGTIYHCPSEGGKVDFIGGIPYCEGEWTKTKPESSWFSW